LIRYIALRLLSAIPTVIGVVAIVFLMVRLVPGDPIDYLMTNTENRQGTEQYEALRRQLGLDRPILEQFVRYCIDVAHGDLGSSVFNGRSVSGEILRRLPNTIKLTSASLLVTVVVGVTTGVIAATRKGGIVDLASMVTTIIFVSVPGFWFGLMAILLFSLKLGWLPVAGTGSWKHLVLPALTLGIRSASTLARITRSTMLDVLGQDYVRTARAKGLQERVVIYRHALRTAAIPIATVLGFEVGALLSGAFIVETVFAYPGIGHLAVQSLITRDFPMIQGTILFVAIVYVLVNLIVDLAYSLLDPRIRYV
jgi:peptide/nickel transport system permease protein/oligopeptide transport system permease protein